MEDLVTLPGVGRKTANIVLNKMFDRSTASRWTRTYRIFRAFRRWLLRRTAALLPRTLEDVNEE